MAGRWTAVAGVAVGALVLAACGDGAGGGADGKTEITFSYLWTGTEGEAMEKIIAEFNESQDEIVVRGVSSPDQQKQLTAMSSAKGAFDISDSYDFNVGAWGSKGIVEPLDGFIENDGYDLKDYVPSAMKGMRYGGKTYALPIAMHNYQLIYNKKLLRAAGYDEPPATTQDWAEAIGKLTKTGKGGAITQLGFGGTDPQSIDPRLQVMAYAFGGEWYDDEKATPANPGNAAALEFFADSVTRRYGVDNVRKFVAGHGEYASAQNAFFAGRVAMVIDGEWISKFAQQFAPDLEWGVAPIPHPADRPELKGSTYVHSSTMFIPRNSEHKEEAWEFMKFVLAKKAMRDFTASLGNLPTRTSLLDDPVYDELPNFAGWADALKTGHQHWTPPTEWVAEYNTDLTTALESAATLKRSPQQALADVGRKAKGYGGS